MLLYYTKQLYTKYTSLLKAQVHRMRYTREAGIYIALCKLVYSKISNIESVSQFNHNRLFVKLFQQVSNAVSKSENWGWWLKTQGYKLKPIIYRKCLKWTFSYILEWWYDGRFGHTMVFEWTVFCWRRRILVSKHNVETFKTWLNFWGWSIYRDNQTRGCIMETVTTETIRNWIENDWRCIEKTIKCIMQFDCNLLCLIKCVIPSGIKNRTNVCKTNLIEGTKKNLI